VDLPTEVRKANEEREHHRQESIALRHDWDRHVREGVRIALSQERADHALREQQLQATVAQLRAAEIDKQAAHDEQLRVAQATIDGLRLQLDHTIAAHGEETRQHQALLAHVYSTIKTEPE